MKTVAVHEISKSWNAVLQQHAGAEVAVTNRGQIVAYLRVLPHKKGQKVKMPDFKSRIQARFGQRTLTSEDVTWLDQAM